MRASSFALLVALAGLAAVAVSMPSRAGGLSDLVGFGAQDVYIDPPAGTADSPGATNTQKDPGAPAAGKTAKQKQVRLSKACRKAGVKTREDCDAFLARAKKPARTTPEETTAKTTPAETTVKEEGTAGTATGETSATTTTGATSPAATSGATATAVTVVPMASTAGNQPSSNAAITTANPGGDNGLPAANTGGGSSTLGVLVK